MDSFMQGMVFATIVMLLVPVTVGLSILIWYWRSRRAKEMPEAADIRSSSTR
ncbi:MAG TPA: hypothetical protein VN848_04830 [Gemmatimonadales bacterium]|nr:hypothetical protein [Gemmatimonadales bacterium]